MSTNRPILLYNPSLKKFARKQFIKNFKDPDEIQGFLSENNHVSLPFCEKQLKKRQIELQNEIDYFLELVIHGNLVGVEGYLKDTKNLAFWLKSTGTARLKLNLKTTIAKGTALQIALGAADTARQHIIMKKICQDELIFKLDNKDFIVRRGDEAIQLSGIHLDMIREIFREQTDSDLISLSNEQLPAYTALIKAAKANGYTPKEEMVELLQRYLKQLPDGEIEVAKQTTKQFPSGWEMEASAQHQQNLIWLTKIFKAIIESNLDFTQLNETKTEGNISQLDSELEIFRAHFVTKDAIATGHHFDPTLLFEAFKLGMYFEGKDFCHRAKYYYQKVIGFIQALVPVNFGMAQVNGLDDYLYHSDEKLTRWLFNKTKVVGYFQCHERNKYLGINNWIDYEGHNGTELSQRPHYRQSRYNHEYIQCLCISKFNTTKLLCYQAQQVLNSFTHSINNEEEPHSSLRLR